MYIPGISLSCSPSSVLFDSIICQVFTVLFYSETDFGRREKWPAALRLYLMLLFISFCFIEVYI